MRKRAKKEREKAREKKKEIKPIKNRQALQAWARSHRGFSHYRDCSEHFKHVNRFPLKYLRDLISSIQGISNLIFQRKEENYPISTVLKALGVW